MDGRYYFLTIGAISPGSIVVTNSSLGSSGALQGDLATAIGFVPSSALISIPAGATGTFGISSVLDTFEIAVGSSLPVVFNGENDGLSYTATGTFQIICYP